MSETGSFVRLPKASTLTPWLLGLTTTVAFSALTFAYNVKVDMALLKAQQLVSPVEFATLKSDVAYQEKEIERLRSWIKSHRHYAGQPRASEEPPAPAER